MRMRKLRYEVSTPTECVMLSARVLRAFCVLLRACTCIRCEYSKCVSHSPSQRRKRSFRQARENALSDEKARSQVFISAVKGWLSLLDSIGLSDVQVQNVSVLGKDGEVK